METITAFGILTGSESDIFGRFRKRWQKKMSRSVWSGCWIHRLVSPTPTHPTPSKHWQNTVFWKYNIYISHPIVLVKRSRDSVPICQHHFALIFPSVRYVLGGRGEGAVHFFLHFQRTLNLSSSLWRVWYMYIVFMQSLSFIQKVSFVLK